MPKATWTMADFDWSSPVRLDPHRHDVARFLATQSSYAEEAGMLIASKLARSLEDRDGRRMLAQQSAEEARHSELFERYIEIRLDGTLPAADDAMVGLLDLLESYDNPFQLFLIHTFFEAFALDQFSFLGDNFEDDLLSSIYGTVRADEANHVFMGISFLKRHLPRLPKNDVEELREWCLSKMPELSRLPEVVSVIERTATKPIVADIAGLLQHRFENRCRQIFSTSVRSTT